MSELLSVTEFAKRTGKDPGNLRKLLAAGRLKGVKVGNQWCIPADAVLPPDGRVKSGAYKNWRKPKSE